MRYRIVIFLMLLALAAPALAQGEAGDLIGRINALRGSLGLPGYTLNGALAAAAQSQAQWMVETGTVSHTRPDGSTPRARALNAGYTTTEVSENIYGGTNASVNDAWTFWINSRIHYAGLTNARYKEIGIGIARSAWGAAYVLVFGNPGGPAYVPPQVSAGSGGDAGQPSFVAGLDSHGNIMHEVQPNDTLGDIALIYGYTWGDIPAMLAINGLSEADIRELEIGSIFLVPPKSGTYTPTAPPEPSATATPEVSLPTAPDPALMVTITPSPAPPAAESPPPSPTATFAGIATLDSVPQVLALVQPTATPTPSDTPETATSAPQNVALAATSAPQANAAVRSPGVVTPAERGSPWLAVALLVQVIVLLAAGYEFIRRLRRRPR